MIEARKSARYWMPGLLALAIVIAAAAIGCSSSDSNTDGVSCTVNADCQFGYRCLNQTCVSLECGTARDCLTGEYCYFATSATEVGVCTPRPDTDGDEPDGDVADGDEPDGDEPVGVCNSGDKRCRGDILEICEVRNALLDWRFSQECAYGCQLGVCNEPPEVDGDGEAEPVCTPGDMQCYSNQVQSCPDDGMQWDVDDPCLGGTCIEEVQQNGLRLADCGPKIVCEPGMRVCEDAGDFDAVKICNNDGTDWDLTYCAPQQACIGGICQSASECTRGRYRCNGSNVEICRDNGTGWDVVKSCVEGESTCACGQYAGSECALADCVANAVCTPLLDTQCSGTVVQRCDSSGTGWAFWSDCADKDPPQTCVNGACE